MTILLDTPFNIGDVVCSKLDNEYTYIVNSFNIHCIDQNGVCLSYTVDCGDPTGVMRMFKPYEIDLVEAKSNEIK